MRHGEAIDPYAAAEPHRHLTAHGRRVSHDVGVALRTRGLVPTAIYSSPLVRAVQTAERVADATGYAGEIAIEAHLVPGGTSGLALAVLARHGGDDVVLLVSHEPTVRDLAAELSGLGHGFPSFRTSGVAVVELGGERGILEGRIDPGGMRWRDASDLDG
jgi:phosphohistidine phosphatase